MADEASTQTLTPTGIASAQPSPINAAWSQSAGILGSMRGFIREPAIVRAMPLIILSAVIMAALSVWLVLREPPQRDLFRGLPDQDKASVMQALKSANIAYQIESTTGALTVGENDYHNAKIELAGQGLPRSAPSGDSIMSNMPMGASRAVETEKLRSAREMDLARSIEALDNVLSARVHLAVEQPSIFLRERNEPAASVILHVASSAPLDDRQTQAIVNLVANSVSGLSAANVSVIDQNGRLLSQSDGSPSADSSDKNLKIKAAIEDRYRQALISLLTPIVGPGNFVAQVTAEVNFDEKQATSETYPADSSVLRFERGTRSDEPASGSQDGGIPGALANRPPQTATFEDQPDGKEEESEKKTQDRRTSEEYQRKFETAREIAVINEAPGQVSRLSVAVAINDSALKGKKDSSEIKEIESLVKGTVGFSADRGDQIAVNTRKFKTISTQEVTSSWYETSWFSMLARNLSALVVALILVFGIGRPVLKRWMNSEKNRSANLSGMIGGPNQAASNGSSAQSGVVAGTDGAASLPAPAPVTIDMIQAAPSYQERALLTQNFVKQNPDHAAMVVKELLKEAGEMEAVDG